MKANVRVVLIIFCAWLPAGCIISPLPPLPPPYFPDQWHSTTAATPSVQAWLDDFSSPHLSDLVHEALLHNHSLQQAGYRRAAARKRVEISASRLWPTVEAGLDRTRAKSMAGGEASTQTKHTLEGSIRWEPDLWGRIFASKRSAEAQAWAAEADYKAAQRSLAADVAHHWFGVIESEQQHRLATRSLASYRRSVEVIKEQYRVGLADALDLHLARSDVARAEATLAQRQRDQAVALRNMETLLGRYPRGELETEHLLPQINTPVPAGLPSDLLQRRPDLLAAKQRLQAAGELLEEARKNRFPSLQLSASTGNASQELRHILDWDNLVWRLVGGLVQPVFQGGKLKAEEALARIERKESWAAYAHAILVAFREVETALVMETHLQTQEKALSRAVTESTLAVDLALSRYRSGLVHVTTLLESQRRAYQAESAYLKVSQERLNNRVNLYLALGGDFHKEKT